MNIDSLKFGDIVLFPANSVIGKIISDITGSPYSHSELYIGNGKIIGAVEDGIGVGDIYNNARKYTYLKFLRPIKTKGIDYHKMKKYIRMKKGSKYNIFKLVTFPFEEKIDDIQEGREITDEDLEIVNSFICSEFVSATYRYGGYPLFAKKKDSVVAPSHLNNCEKLKPVAYMNSAGKLTRYPKTSATPEELLLNSIKNIKMNQSEGAILTSKINRIRNGLSKSIKNLF